MNDLFYFFLSIVSTTSYIIAVFLCHRCCQWKGDKPSTPFTLPVMAVIVLIAAASVAKFLKEGTDPVQHL